MILFKQVKKTLKRIMPLREASFLREKDKLQSQLEKQQKTISTITKSLRTQNAEIQMLRNELRKLNKDIRHSAWGNYKLSNRDAINAYISTLPVSKYPEELCRWFFYRTGRILNLENPVTFNEKIQWLKLFDSTPLKTQLADKYLVRDWIREKIGEQYLVPLLGVWERFDDIDFDSLPDQFVLKTNHGCKSIIMVKDKSLLDQSDANEKFSKWLRINYAMYGLELQYQNIKPLIIAEQYLENENDNLHDYKVFCFNGRAESIKYHLSDQQVPLQEVFYDLNWNRLPFSDGPELSENDAPKPERLEEMISLAETLSAGFSFVRVDFYVLNNGDIKFGEMTFTPSNGISKWSDENVNIRYGNLITLPEKSPLP